MGISHGTAHCVIRINHESERPYLQLDFTDLTLGKLQEIAHLPQIKGKESSPLEHLADSLACYIGSELVDEILCPPVHSIDIYCMKDEDVPMVVKHVRDYLTNRVGLTVREDTGVNYRGPGVER